MFLAGIPIPNALVLELAHLVDDEDLEMRLRGALARDVKILGLTVEERGTVVRALDDPPAGLEPLRATLLQEHVQRVRDGLV